MTEDQGWFSEETATFGDRLAGAREAAGLDQSAFAAKLGVRKNVVVSWENDLKEPRANRLQMMSGILGGANPAGISPMTCTPSAARLKTETTAMP